MSAFSQSLCLNMIVKNEATVIRRCLDSVRPIIDRWVIVDTGSTDGTQDIIREHLRDLPGELHERTWRDFAYNRSEALTLARGMGDYTLIIDADDALEIALDTALPALTADSYMIDIEDTATVYRRTQLVRNVLPWRYEGVLHEYITCDEAGPPEHIEGIRMRRNHDGARRRDPETYKRDAEILEAALQTETDPFLLARYRFYLAQSYRDCQEWEKALEHYLVRAELGFWQEEVFISLYCAAQAKQQLGHPGQEVIDAYLRATAALPTRVEALHGASRFCRQERRHEEGYRLAKRGLAIPMPTDGLFVEPWIYQIGLLDELSINAYWSGHFKESLDASLEILAAGKLSGAEIGRVVENARFASAKLPPDDPHLTKGVERTEELLEEDTEPVRLAALQQEADSCALLAQIALARGDVADALRQYEEGLRVLANAAIQPRFLFSFLAAGVVGDFGTRADRNDALEAAVVLYRHALDNAPRAQRPNDWAATQNNLGNVLQALAVREKDTARLAEAVAAYRSVLEEHSSKRASWDWTAIHNNLGNALRILGERENGMGSPLEEAP
jgi:glycosyltransferase involved in cell wall biosynthesis